MTASSTAKGSPDTSKSTVGSVSRALDLLEALAEQGEVGLVKLARSTGLQASTTHRLLATLVRRGYVCRNVETGAYLLGYRVLRIASSVERRDIQLRVMARPFMQRIHKVCGETTNLIVLEGSEIVYIDQIVGSGAMRMFAEPGQRVSAHTTAAGKAMLAFCDPTEVTELLEAAAPLKRFTAHTITTVRGLLDELEEIRVDGFAVDREEHAEALSCVAAPIFDHAGGVLAALSVSGPTVRLTGVADFDALGELIGRAGIECSRELGYLGGSPWHTTVEDPSV
jgi:DNA-binding IclR family transcriptional regulator